ncbi:T-cell acute lymphocytic leukemia protein 1 [Striga asiatica]|uniref:T-cell acute lymphocytic leukemia protein 1 n=1 Tax=Striga asiatica TaxID=4170 RepID=A0A5A7PFN7_STRAF|nr:T-cell acute lymphocytic leukemia protein 1 [Striga asiatica]
MLVHDLLGKAARVLPDGGSILHVLGGLSSFLLRAAPKQVSLPSMPEMGNETYLGFSPVSNGSLHFFSNCQPVKCFRRHQTFLDEVELVSSPTDIDFLSQKDSFSSRTLEISRSTFRPPDLICHVCYPQVPTSLRCQSQQPTIIRYPSSLGFLTPSYQFCRASLTSRAGHFSNETIHERQRIARRLPHPQRPITHVCLHWAVVHVIKPICTRVLVSEGGAHPRLHVADLEPQPLSSPRQAAHLPEGPSYLVHRVLEHRQAVPEGGGGPGVWPVVGPSGEVAQIRRRSGCPRQAYADGDGGEAGRVTADGGGVAREGVVADVGLVWINSAAAGMEVAEHAGMRRKVSMSECNIFVA